MPKAVKTLCIICCLCLLISLVCIPAHAAQIAEGAVDPADYISDIIYEGEKKTIVYDFSPVPWYIVYEDYGGGYFESASGHWQGPVNGSVGGGTVVAYPLDWSEYFPAPLNTLYIGDISPGAELAYTYDLHIQFDLCNWDDYPRIDVRLWEMCYMWDENLNYIGVIEGPASEWRDGSLEGHMYVPGEQDCITVSGVFPSYAAYVRPVVNFSFNIDWDTSATAFHQTYFTVDASGFELQVDINAVKSDSDLMNAINNKLEDLGDQIGDINNNLGDVNDKLDEILDQPAQEKEDANQAGKDAIKDVISVVPDHSDDLVDAFSGLASSMSYNGTVAKLDIPAVNMPGLDGLFDGFTVMEPQTIDFEVYFDMLPDELLLLVQSLFTAALIVYCFKELYSTIQYCMTLRG